MKQLLLLAVYVHHTHHPPPELPCRTKSTLGSYRTYHRSAPMMRAIGDARVARMISRCWIHCGVLSGGGLVPHTNPRAGGW